MEDMELSLVDEGELGCGFGERVGEEGVDGVGEVVEVVVEVFDEGFEVGFHDAWIGYGAGKNCAVLMWSGE